VWDTVCRLTPRCVRQFLALFPAVLAHTHVCVHETSPSVHCNTQLPSTVTNATLRSSRLTAHERRRASTTQRPNTLQYGHALQAGARVDKAGASATLRALGRGVQHDPQTDTMIMIGLVG
jgi:hypothetical protein